MNRDYLFRDSGRLFKGGRPRSCTLLTDCQLPTATQLLTLSPAPVLFYPPNPPKVGLKSGRIFLTEY